MKIRYSSSNSIAVSSATFLQISNAYGGCRGLSTHGIASLSSLSKSASAYGQKSVSSLSRQPGGKARNTHHVGPHRFRHFTEWKKLTCVMMSTAPSTRFGEGKFTESPGPRQISESASKTGPELTSISSITCGASLAAVGTAATAGVVATSCEHDETEDRLDEGVSISSSRVPNETRTESFVRFPEECLKADTYNGITIDVSKLPLDLLTNADNFGVTLGGALSIWKKEGRRGIWLTVPREHASLIPVAIQHGFDFQYAEKGFAVLTCWLPTESESRLPNGPTHQVGIGAFVVHPITNQILVVQEKSGPAAAHKLWKMPTGLAEPGEDIADTAIREIKEETGLDCVFESIVCFRQAHGPGAGGLNRSDLFFVCKLKLAPSYEGALSRGENIVLLPQEEEIADAKWIDKDIFANQELWSSSPLYREMNSALLEAIKVADFNKKDANMKRAPSAQSVFGETPLHKCRIVGFVGKKLPVGFRPGTNTLYVSPDR